MVNIPYKKNDYFLSNTTLKTQSSLKGEKKESPGFTTLKTPH